MKGGGYIPLKDLSKSCYVFTDDLRECSYCGRKFLSNEELLFHMEGCITRQRTLYPNKKKDITTNQLELGRWLPL